MTRALVLLAVALLLVPGRREVRAGGGAGAARRRAAAATPAATPAALVLSVLACGVACVVAAGPRTGLGAAALVCPAVAFAVRRAQVRRPGVTPDRGLALALDLAAAALRSGRPLAEALAAAAPAAGSPAHEALVQVGGLARLGAAPEQAWAGLADGPLAGVSAAAVRSSASGLRLAGAFEAQAARVRADVLAAATARAHRAGVLAMAPLAACFLPSFVCLGIVPVVVGVARTATGVLP